MREPRESRNVPRLIANRRDPDRLIARIGEPDQQRVEQPSVISRRHRPPEDNLRLRHGHEHAVTARWGFCDRGYRRWREGIRQRRRLVDQQRPMRGERKTILTEVIEEPC